MSVATNDILNPYRTIGSTRSAIELAEALTQAERERPAVVVSTTKNGPLINPAALATKLGPDVDVYLLSSAGLAYDFQDAMPVDTAVYGGAARCYPPGNAWANNSTSSMVRLAYTDAEGRAAVHLLADDVAAMPSLMSAKVMTSSAPQPRGSVRVEGIVSVLLEPDGVLVKLDDGIARIDTSVFAPGISPERLFTASQKVTGTVRDGVLTITDGRFTPADAADHAAKGCVFPALVISPKTVALFPGLTVRHSTGEREGTVIAVSVVLSGRADGKAWKLATVAEPGEVEDALPFMAGGEPWIRWEPAPAATAVTQEPEPVPDQQPTSAPVPDNAAVLTPEPADDVFASLDAVRARLEYLSADNSRLSRELHGLLLADAASQESTPVPSPSLGGAEIARLRAQVALLSRQKADMISDHRRAMHDADDLAAENTRFTHANEKLREQVRAERARADRARQLSRDIDDVSETGPLFNDPEAQFRHEVYLEWATRIPAGSKAETPLAEYGFADGFLSAVDTIQGVDRSKIIAVAVEVLAGLADSMPGRDMHRLRGGLPGGASFVEDPEMGTAWRVALQVKTASARRMHFWRGTDGKIVFATVGVHDDMDI